jgi:NADH-quinone oxidoreductase subunit M
MAAFLGLLVLGWGCVEISGSRGLAPWWAVLPLTLAILIRSGIAPFHCWMTDLFENTTFGTAMLFITPMSGPYAAVRLLFPIAPEWVLSTIGVLALLTALYAAGMALAQTEVRRFYCYLLVSHSALVLVGMDTTEAIGLTGGLCVWLSVSLALAGFGQTLRALEARHGRLSLKSYHGLYEHTPALAVCFLLTGLASVGFPGTFGFLGTEMLVDGAVEAYPYVGVAVVLVAALNGIAVVKAYFLLFTGKRHVSAVPLGIGRRERFAVLTLAVLILLGGVFPQMGVASRHQAAEDLIKERERRTSDGEPRTRPVLWLVDPEVGETAEPPLAVER